MSSSLAEAGVLHLTIPGVNASKDAKTDTTFMTASSGNTSYTMVPQGICFAKNYVLFTGYDSDNQRSSVVWIKDVKSDRLVATLELPDKQHVGGICYDGTNIWIPIESNYVRYIRFSDVETQISKGYSVFNLTIADDTKKAACVSISINNGKIKTGTNRDAATVCFFDGYLYLAEFNGGSIKNKNPKLTKFEVSYKNGNPSKLTAVANYALPDYVQSVQIYSKNSNTYVLLGCSYGRKANSTSRIDICKLDNLNKKVKSIDLSKNSNYLMLEGMAIQDQYLYLITESAAWLYKQGTDNKGRSPNPRNDVYAIKINDLF